MKQEPLQAGGREGVCGEAAALLEVVVLGWVPRTQRFGKRRGEW